MSVPAEANLLFLGLCTMKGVGFDTLRKIGGIAGIGRQLERRGAEELEISPGRLLSGPDYVSVRGAGIQLFEELDLQGISLYGEDDAGYPSSFAQMSESLRPYWFFAKGEIYLLEAPGIAVVGTRSPSDVGEFLTRYAASVVGEIGCPLVSGLAAGVDATAHSWSVKAFSPNISILGTGIRKTYPAKHDQLADAIVHAGGLLLSEYLPDAPPNAESFVWRNRLQAALSACVVAPEWKRTSGTAHTIRFAKRLGRPTINLCLDGLLLPDDHGESDVTFDVPSQNTEFTDYLSRTLASTTDAPKVTQQRLFG
ncbi:DNA-processing protein DprA [Xanthomonas oryzae]|uniref:DNA-processing protein DprA n=1 Tax=Xanthomonas oryzae TaxID=347 RepID=UPI00094A15E7|nr:DNA-processing protein DprA [Xanthomonas oryzae]